MSLENSTNADLPLLYEDEGPEMGESLPHTRSSAILYLGLQAHFGHRTDCAVIEDLNVHYDENDEYAYVSPDLMIVFPPERLADDLRFYQVGTTGPAPRLVIEVLSHLSYQQMDLTHKPTIYSHLGVRELVFVDVLGESLPQRLELRRLQNDGNWSVHRDEDGGLTSELGFRIAFDEKDQLRVVNAETGERYLHPEETPATTKALREAQQEIQRLRNELANVQSPSKEQ